MEHLLHSRKNAFVFILVFCISVTVYSQSFKKLSRPEKCWVVFHPCKAKKAATVTKQVQKDVDSIKQIGIIGKDNNGGALDAFKHCYWMAMLTQKIGSKNARKIGNAHEKGNYLQFKKHKLEDAILPDSISSEMDLFNNQVGIYLMGHCKNLSANTIQKKIMDELKNGKLKMIKKDAQGNFLTCDEQVIVLSEWKKKWGNPKCLIDSHF